jgi:hypothetical protein
MSLTAAAGSISKAIENLRTTLADCSTFRNGVGAGDAPTALEHVFYEALPPPAEGSEYSAAELVGYRPYALVSMEVENGFQAAADAHGSHFEFDESGVLSVWFEDNVEPSIAEQHGEISRRFLNVVGSIVDELQALAGTGGYLAAQAIEVVMGPGRGALDERSAQGDYVALRLRIAWGPAS